MFSSDKSFKIGGDFEYITLNILQNKNKLH